MKRYYIWSIPLSVVLLCLLLYRLTTLGGGGVLVLPERSFNFGPITDSVEVTHIFAIRNTGDGLLTINEVSASCGCTIASLDKKQLAPGDSAKLNVTLNPKNKGIGPIDKKIWIKSNSRDNPLDSLIVSAMITEIHPQKMSMTISGIFEGDCRRCHVAKGEGKFGMDLFKADCLMCHSASKTAHAPSMDSLFVHKLQDSTLRHLLIHGIPRTNMPAFGKSHGGPLSDTQIRSLVQLLAKVP